MSEDMDQVAWGRLLERLDSIKKELSELKDRTIWRLDNLEGRVEHLERSQSGMQPYLKIAERVVWVLLIAGTATGIKLLGS